MYGGVTYSRRGPGLLSRPRLGGSLRAYLRPRLGGLTSGDMARSSRKPKTRKLNGFHKMDPYKKRMPDYTDIAYREAVSRLKYLLAESYNPQSSGITKYSQYRSRPDDSDNETEISYPASEHFRHGHIHTHTHYFPYKPPYTPKRTLFIDSTPKLTHAHSTLSVPQTDVGDATTKSEAQPPPELLNFIEKQEEYIEQLEKESQYCRDELSNLLGKVKEVISENEHLHEKEKLGVLKSVFDSYETGDDEDENHVLDEDIKLEKKSPSRGRKKRLEGPSIVFESRITELEAQLTQTKLDLKKAQEEAASCKRKLSEQPYSTDLPSLSGVSDSALRQQVESLQREKNELNDKIMKLQSSLAEFKEKETDATYKVKRSKDVMDQTQFEKTQLELEVRRLKDELEHQHEKQREMIHEQGRRIQDERGQAERRYAQQVEQLSTELAAQWDNASKLQLDLEKQRRTEAELRRELQQKQSIIDELKKELAAKTSGLQSEVLQAAVERGTVEQELIASRLSAERSEREAKQETSRLQAEVTALRQRLDRADADLLHSRRENFRLSEKISSLERELNLAKILQDTADKGVDGSPDKASQREKELSSMVKSMDDKHVETVAELENMIKSQNQVMEKLKDECHLLTEKLEESSTRHKIERTQLKEDNAVLTDKLEQLWISCKELLGVEQYQTHMMGGPKSNSNNLQTMMHNMNRSSNILMAHSSNRNNMSHSSNPCQTYNMAPTNSNFHLKSSGNQNLNNSPYPNPMPSMNNSSYLTESMNNRHNNISKNEVHNMILETNLVPNMDHKPLIPNSVLNTNLSYSIPKIVHKNSLTANMSQEDSPVHSLSPSMHQKQNMIHSTDSRTNMYLQNKTLVPKAVFKSNILISSTSHKDNTWIPSMNLRGSTSSPNISMSQEDSPLRPSFSLSQKNSPIVLTSNHTNKKISAHNMENCMIHRTELPKKMTTAPSLDQEANTSYQQVPQLNIVRSHSTSQMPNHSVGMVRPDSDHLQFIAWRRYQQIHHLEIVPHHNTSQISSGMVHPNSDHLPLSPWRQCEVVEPPLTLEDLATDSDSFDSQSAQHCIFR